MPPKLRVLLVDDNPQDRGLVVRELRKAYPEVEVKEAIDQAKLDEQILRAEFDLVITDYHLHWSDGIRVLQSIKRRLPNCPVIMFTGTGSEEIAVEAMKQGLDDYIIKNVKHLIRLRGAVQAVLEHASTRKRVDRLASRLESILSQLQVGVFSCSSAGHFLELNDAMAGLSASDFGPDTTLKSYFPDEAQAEAFLEDIVSSNEPRETEIELKCSPDQTRIYRVNAQLVADGEQTRIDGLLEDVTRRKQSEATSKQTAVAVAQIAMLSPREKEVLQEVVEGRANKVIGRRLEISEKTVEKHRSNLMKKLRVRSVAELVRLAMLAESSVR